MRLMPDRRTIERDATLYPYHAAIAIHRQREREIEERLRRRGDIQMLRRESSLRARRWLGHRLIRLGWALACDGQFQPSTASFRSPMETPQ
jgi:hypothetical protein